jgi:hypothetical protein
MPDPVAPDLVTLQAAMAEALLSGRAEVVAGWIEPGPIAAEEALSVHRNTALHGLVNALRLSHPTVAALVGEDFFDQAARDFVRAFPPASAWLTGYGEGFAAFLAGYGPVRELPYLADVARFDFAIEAVGGEAPGLDGAALDLGEAVLVLDGSLRLTDLDFPAAAIRDAIDDEAALAALDVSRCRHVLALWRLADGVGLRRLGPVSAAFVKAVLAGEDPGEWLSGGADVDALQTEVFTAPFVRLSLKPV